MSVWASYLANLESSSRRCYVRVVNDFQKFLADRPDDIVNEAVLLEYSKRMPVEASTKISYMSIVFRYCSMALGEDLQWKNCPLVSQHLKKEKIKHKTKKAAIFDEKELRRFWSLDLPPQDEWLKLVSIIAFYGWARSDDLNQLNFENVRFSDRGIHVRFERGKTDSDDKGGLEFVIVFENSPAGPAELFQRYYNQLPERYRSGKLFKRWKNNVTPPGYRMQHHGMNHLKMVGSRIAEILEIPNPQAYTGHCFRRSGATHMANAGASTKQLKCKGRWASDSVADRYIGSSTKTLEKDARMMQDIPSDQGTKRRRVEEETKPKDVPVVSNRVTVCTIS